MAPNLEKFVSSLDADVSDTILCSSIPQAEEGGGSTAADTVVLSSQVFQVRPS